MNSDDLRHLVRRTSISLVPAAHSVWIHGALPSQFDAARRMFQVLAEGRPDLCLLFSSVSSDTARYLKACFPNDQVSPPPIALEPVIRRFFRIANPRLLVLLDGGRSLSAGSLRHTLKAGLSIVVINVGSSDEITPLLLERARQADSLIQFCAKDDAAAQELLNVGIPSRGITVTASLDLEPDRPSQRVPRKMVRQLLGVDDAAPLVVAGPVPTDEVGALLDAFALLREREPSAHLVVEPIESGYSTPLLDESRERDWRTLRRTNPSQAKSEEAWDVQIAEVSGELPALFRGADVAVAGGTFSETRDHGSFASALGSGCSVVVGQTHYSSAFEGIKSAARPWVFPVESPGLGSALRDALDAHRANRSQDETHPCQQPHVGAAQRTARFLRPFLPTPVAAGPEGPTWRVPTWRDGVSDGPVWGAIAPWFAKRRVDDWEGLCERLQRPQSILCLGNGPSCEDPRLAEVDHDCLMRVNWRWREHGFLAWPDMIFVGDFATVQKMSNCLFGIWNEFLEQRMLLRRLTHRGPRRIEYVTMTRLPGVMQARRWTARPSNGALMIVAAAALQPESITIGGMDLFMHPAGRYPNEIRTRNEYSRVHTRENELAMIDLALRDFRGEIIILSDILRDSLEEYRERQHEQTASTSSAMS